MTTTEKLQQEEADKKMILREYRKLLKSLKPRLNKANKKLLRLAFEMAADAHKDMRRKSGEPYILHPLAVAQIVVDEIGLGVTSAICALLHDTVEDTEVTLKDIELDFGSKIKDIVLGLTKISSLGDIQNTTSQAENFRKILVTLADDPRVILIKIADRLHNMRTMDSMKREKQLKISSETQYVYSPLAHRLGLYNIKTELEDLCMRYTDREMYDEISNKLEITKRERSRYINDFIKPIKELLDKQNINAEIKGRPKSISSIWHKMKNKNVAFEEVFDLFAIRIIFFSEIEKEEAWKIFSLITDIYNPKPERLRDWISYPKSNGYEALHTTVMGPKGKWVEIQIRSKRQNDIAEQGLAAHWKYKEVGVNAETNIDEWLGKVRDLISDPDQNSLDFLHEFQFNLFNKEIYVYTPKGEMKVLPTSATALDLAFEIHTELGKKCIGAKVNFKLVPLNHELKSGDQVEIITSQKQKPNEDWLKFVKTSKARGGIRDFFKEKKRELAEEGKKILSKNMQNLKIQESNYNLSEIQDYYKQTSLLDLYYYFATHNIKLSFENGYEILGNKLIIKKAEQVKLDPVKFPNKTLDFDSELIIFGEKSDKIKYSLAQCCQPIPGDDVFGFISLNEGVKIHRTNCPNAPSLLARYGHRVVKTKWYKNKDITFLSGLKIIGMDDVGVISKLTNIISGELNINMQSLAIDSNDGLFEGIIKVYISDKDELEKLITKIYSLDGIHSVLRMDAEEDTN